MDVFTLAAKLRLDSKDFEKDLAGGESKFAAFGNKIKSALGGIAKISATALGAAAGAFIPLVKSAKDAYASYEQLVGGVETLFGARGAKTVGEYAETVGKSVDAVQKDFDRLKAAESKVLENADKAYMTAGMSANEYMETVTSFSAALISGLRGNTDAAADIADMAIQDMSDNANKMGTDISAIQSAYQGFAKQNYTMLDNLNTMGALAA